MAAILNASLPYDPIADARAMRLPGTRPVDPDGWMMLDDAYAAQMAERDRLLRDRREDVVATAPDSTAAQDEMLDTLLDRLTREPGYDVQAEAVTRPDGVRVPLDRRDPMGTIGRLMQEDVCLLTKRYGAAEHVLSAAVLCFPASWTLSEKIGKPLMRVHKPVPNYDPDVGRRVQRLFDGIREGRPVWRANAHLYAIPDLFSPRREDDPARDEGHGDYVRSERQVLFRLPISGAVVFTIHTFVVPAERLSANQRSALEAQS